MRKVNYSHWGIIIVISFLVIARFLYLDQDAPSYMISGICQEDEAAYCWDAIIKTKADNGNVLKGFEQAKYPGLIMAYTPLTYFCLKLFGFTYYGLRIPSVILSLLIFFFLAKSLGRVSGNNRFAILLFILFLLSDFYFLLFSRFQTPQIYSLFIISIILWSYFKYGYESKRGLFLLGLLTSFAFTVVYVYTIFIFAAFGMFVLLQSVFTKRIFFLLYFIIGVIASIAIYFLLHWFAGASVLDDFNLMKNTGGGLQVIEDSKAGSFTLFTIINASVQLLLTNFFRYNLSILLIFLIVIPLAIYTIVTKKDKNNFILLLCVLFLLLQSVFVISYPFKKLIVLFPIVVMLIAYNIKYIHYFTRNNFSKIIFIIWILISAVFCFYNYKTNNNPIYWSGFDYGYYVNTSSSANIFNLVIFITILITVAIWVWNVSLTKYLKYVLILIICPGIIYSMLYIYKNKHFAMRDALTSLKKEVSGKTIVLDLSPAYIFYNDAIPVLNAYEYQNINDTTITHLTNELFDSGKGNFRIIKFFKHQKKFNHLKPGNIYDENSKHYLVVHRILELPYYNLLVLKNQIK
ncbi:MAG: hypothetical protein V1781_08155 [Bacteroidota bacterium]